DEPVIRRHGWPDGDFDSEREWFILWDVDRLAVHGDRINLRDEEPLIVDTDGGLLAVLHRQLWGTHIFRIRGALDRFQDVAQLAVVEEQRLAGLELGVSVGVERLLRGTVGHFYEA